MGRSRKRRPFAVFLTATSISAIISATAVAKDATCFSTDDGRYPCDFQSFGADGSFVISAPGKPTFTLAVERPGVAFGSAVFEPGGRSVALPGLFYRSVDDPGCWINDATATVICAW